MNTPFATLPEPPYYAVIFSSLRNADDDAGYAAAADRMLELAAQQPGYLGAESTRGADGFGITVSYWQSEEAIAGWRRNAEHSAIRERGFAHFVERAHGAALGDFFGLAFEDGLQHVAHRIQSFHATGRGIGLPYARSTFATRSSKWSYQCLRPWARMAACSAWCFHARMAASLAQ